VLDVLEAARQINHRGGTAMTLRNHAHARRRFLGLTAAAAVAAPCCRGLLWRAAHAQEQLSEDDELAQQLGYKANAAEVDVEEWPEYVKGHHCANCALYQGAEGEASGPCQLFEGKLVSADGWCQAWLERVA
jgi:hypothetical protein